MSWFTGQNYKNKTWPSHPFKNAHIFSRSEMKFMIQQDDLQLLKENTGNMANKMQFNRVSGRYCCVTPVLSLRKNRSVMEIWKRLKTDQLFF